MSEVEQEANSWDWWRHGYETGKRRGLPFHISVAAVLSTAIVSLTVVAIKKPEILVSLAAPRPVQKLFEPSYVILSEIPTLCNGERFLLKVQASGRMLIVCERQAPYVIRLNDKMLSHIVGMDLDTRGALERIAAEK